MASLLEANPKRSRGQGGEWYAYYAGFSSEFADLALEELDVRPGGVVLDPWNGSGTTTAAAASSGLVAIGLDINPVMALIASGRLAECSVVEGMRRLAECPRQPSPARRSDALRHWFDSETCALLRTMATRVVATYRRHVRSEEFEKACAAGFYFSCMGLMLRELLRNDNTTNPAWFPTSGVARGAHVGERKIAKCMQTQVETLKARLNASGGASLARHLTGDARRMPVLSRTVDAIVTSPPYCTRLDYPIALMPELALLGYRISERRFRKLRDASQGTPTVRGDEVRPEEAWGPTARRLLKAIEEHDSRASDTYYYRVYAQYLQDLASAVGECSRVSRRRATCIIVVQSSWYKELYVDLPRVVIEMFERAGWLFEDKSDYSVRHTLADSNPISISYRKHRGAVESAIRLVRA